jgi:hypothetical protein
LKGVSAIIDIEIASNSLILKRRDVGVVDRARLEIKARHEHQAAERQVN